MFKNIIFLTIDLNIFSIQIFKISCFNFYPHSILLSQKSAIRAFITQRTVLKRCVHFTIKLLTGSVPKLCHIISFDTTGDTSMEVSSSDDDSRYKRTRVYRSSTCGQRTLG